MTTETISSAGGRIKQAIRPRGSRLPWVIATALYVIFLAVVYAHQSIGIAGDPHLANPLVPAPAPPPQTVGFLTSPTGLPLLVLLGILAWLSVRQGRLHRYVIIAVASIATGLLDPLANWATFASLTPRQPHFPTDWPWFRLAPLVEPTATVFGGYTAYYLVTALLFYGLSYLLLLRWAGPSSWVAKHRQLTLFVAVYLLSFPLNAWLQLEWVKTGDLLYTQFFGPILRFGALKVPLLVLFYDPFVYATIAVLCDPDEDGESALLVRIASRLPAHMGEARTTSGRQAVAAALVLMASFAVPIGSFCVIRLAGLAHQVVYSSNPFPEAKVYDPYGDLERAGTPGPFQR